MATEIFRSRAGSPSALEYGKTVTCIAFYAGSGAEIDPADLSRLTIFEFANRGPVKCIGGSQRISFLIRRAQVTVSNTRLKIPNMHSDSSSLPARLKNH